MEKSVAPTQLPPGAGPLIAEAQRALRERRFAEAEQKFAEVLAGDTNNVFTLGQLAVAQLEQKKFTEAEAGLRRALAVAPEDVAALTLLGLLKFRQDKPDEAIEALSRAAKLDPKNPRTQNFLGLALDKKSRASEAEAALRKAIQLAPDYGEAHQNLAVFYATQNPPSKELARWHYQKALSLGGDKNVELEKLLLAK